MMKNKCNGQYLPGFTFNESLADIRAGAAEPHCIVEGSQHHLRKCGDPARSVNIQILGFNECANIYRFFQFARARSPHSPSISS